ncbi:hypothetical protein RugamoR64_22100 [Duganella rhizosphaerae]
MNVKRIERFAKQRIPVNVIEDYKPAAAHVAPTEHAAATETVNR